MKQLSRFVVLSSCVIALASACNRTPAASSSDEPPSVASAPARDIVPMLPPGHSPVGQGAGALPPGHMPAGMGAADLPPGHVPVGQPSAGQPTAGPLPPGADQLPPGHVPVDQAGGTAEPAGGGSPVVAGTVAETMDAAGYTYMRLTTDHGDVWVAAMQMPVAVGNRVEASGSTMPGFHSNTLNRTFDQIVFAQSAHVVGAGGRAAPAPSH